MLEEVKSIVRQAGDIILQSHNARVFAKEGHVNFVTETDIAVEEFLLEALRKLLPESMNFAEEQENAALTDAPTWVVDPIDGTTNFLRDFRISVISVALLVRKQPVLGVIYQPYSRELFWAEKGKGAFLNGEPIHVSEHPFEGAIVGVGSSPYNPSLAAASIRAAAAFLENGDIRRLGTAALEMAYVAAGRMDVYFEYQLSPWDYAAASLLVTEAGGCFGSLTDAVSYEGKSVVLAASANCYRPAQKILQAAY